MKLIDLLVKELPSRGGWPEPEGVICANPQGDVAFVPKDGPTHVISGLKCSFPAKVTREQYEAAIIPNLISTGLHSASHAQFCAAGWTDEQLIEYGYFRVANAGEKSIELPGLSCEVVPQPGPIKHAAHSFLEKGVQHMKDRAAQRDSAGGERSMKACVEAFNAMFDHNLTETQGWQFMVLLKMARSRNKFNPDDYEDGAAYTGLAGEAHSHEQK